MRRRRILLAAAAVTSGLATLGTGLAQPPAGYGQPKPAQPGGTLPATTARPPSGAGARPQPPGGVQPAGGVPNRPRLTGPVMASADGVRPAGGVELPAPSMDLPAVPSGPAGPAPTNPLRPPSVDVEPPAPVGTAPRPLQPAPAGVPDAQPLVPVPPGGAGPAVPLPVPVPAPTVSPVPVPPAVVPPAAGNDNPSSPPPGAARPPAVPAPVSALPSRATHNLTVEAACPESVVFGQEFRYEIIVRNGSTAAVGGVRVEDEVPAGTKYVGSDPPAEMSGDRLAWNVGTLEAGGEKRIAVRLKPGDEGDVRSRAVVSFATAVEVRTKVTRPRIAVAVVGPEACRAGEEASFQIKLTNGGTGPAQRVVLQARLSDGLLHPQGTVIEAELANLPPGESKTVPLKVAAAKAGAQWCQVTIAAEGSPDATAKAPVSVVEPVLQVKQTGPAKCLVRAEPAYEITLANPGTAATDPVTMYTVLPEGFEFVQASDGAAFSPANRAVAWKLPALAPGATKAVTLKVRATAAGDGLLRTIAQAGPDQPPAGAGGPAPAGGVPVRPTARVLEAKAETAVTSEGVSAVRFEVTDLEDPVEVGKEAVYEIRVTNQGTGVCTNVQLVAALPDGTAYTGSSGPTQVKAQGQHLLFEPIQQLGVKGEAVYRVRVKGTAAGEARFRVQLTSDQVRNPVVKEEVTRFYKE